MAVLNDKVVSDLKRIFSKEMGTKKVKLLAFTSDSPECQYCDVTTKLVEEIGKVDERIDVEIFEFDDDEKVVEKYEIEMTPAIIVLGEDGKDYGLRFYGIPSGHEFPTLIEDIIIISNGAVPQLSQKNVERVRKIDKPMKIMVFITPTCPYCPRAVLTAHNIALANDLIKGEMIEAMEFVELSERYRVEAVPHIIISDVHEFVGALPEDAFVDEIMKAYEKMK